VEGHRIGSKGIQGAYEFSRTGVPEADRCLFSGALCRRRYRLAIGRKRETTDFAQLDRVEPKVERAGKQIELTSKEFALLEYLAGHGN